MDRLAIADFWYKYSNLERTLRISPSMVPYFNECPFSVVLSMMNRDDPAKDTDNAYTIRGTTLHSYLEAYIKGEDPNKDKHIEEFNKQTTDEMFTDIRVPREVFSAAAGKGIDALREYLDTHPEIREYEPEQKFVIPLETPRGSKVGEFGGTIDLLNRSARQIIDLKTESRKKATLSKAIIQMNLYALLVYLTTGVKVQKVSVLSVCMPRVMKVANTSAEVNKYTYSTDIESAVNNLTQVYNMLMDGEAKQFTNTPTLVADPCKNDRYKNGCFQGADCPKYR